MSACPSCHQAHPDACSYPGEARPGCLLDKRKRDEINAVLGPATIQYTRAEYTRAKVKLRALFPDAKRIEITPQRLEVEGLPLLPLPALAHVLKVLTKVLSVLLILSGAAAGALLFFAFGVATPLVLMAVTVLTATVLYSFSDEASRPRAASRRKSRTLGHRAHR